MYKPHNILSTQTNPFQNIVLGLILHTTGQSLNLILSTQILIIVFGLIGWFLIIKGYYQIIQKQCILPFHGIYKVLFIFYLLQCIIMIIRGYFIDYNFQWISLSGLINFHLFSPFYILPYLIPLIVFIPIKYYKFNTIVFYSQIFAISLFIVFIVFFNRILISSHLSQQGYTEGNYGFGGNFIDIYIPFSFIILCKRYIKTRIWIYNCIGLLTALLISLIAARRGGSAILSLLLLFDIYIFIKNVKGLKKVFSTIASIAIIIFSIFIFLNSNTFSFIRERGLEDSRTAVDKALLSQMNDTELIFGKGLNGRYYFPLTDDDYLKGWRYGTETGFYNIVLKGGYLMAFTYILLLIYPALVGIFKSKNLLCKALGFYIILSLIELYPFGWLTFNIKFLIIWIGVVLCYNKKIRGLNDKQIYIHFFKKNL